tara:strand:- start:2344 stop:6303 length:3960 start_codon:yes stop_codon:yes gene_type:complete
MVYNPTHNINEDDLVKITRPDGSVIFVRISGVGALTNGQTRELTLDVKTQHNTTFVVDWHNCWSFGNGVESNRIRDSFNNQFVTPGVVVSTIFEDYKKEHLKSGLIYSGLYNSTSGVNNLNQFIQAEKITKKINPIYGSIQKLHSRDTDLIALCEDKIIKILANKDALFNADGNSQLTATNNVLGQSVPFIGEYGISKNPESFTAHSYRSYFTDKSRGAVMRLSRDGLSVISDHGMKSWFNDNLRLSENLIGTYDVRKDAYNLTVTAKQGVDLVDSAATVAATISFKENVKGWSSFKSFFPENGLSCNGNYYTFNQGKPYIHHLEGASHGYTMNFVEGKHHAGYNNFYGTPTGSTITFLLNDEPGIVKAFHTLNYEGTQSRITPLATYEAFSPGTAISTGVYNNPEYHNLTPKDGWYVESVITDIEQGSLNEFIEKEGKWFNYIKGKSEAALPGGYIDVSSFDTSSFSLQGLGGSISVPVIGELYGCTDATAFNYDELAQANDGSCEPVVTGCNNINASNYDSNPSINVESGCVFYGCMDATMFNYDPLATISDGSCVAIVIGCTDPTQFNYNPLANTNSSCIATILGCMNPDANNACTNGCNTEDGSCTYSIYGCTDPFGCFYGDQANVVPFYGMPNIDDGSCWYCSDTSADNYDMPDGQIDCDGAFGDCAYAQPIATWPGDACSTSSTLYPNPATRENTVNTSACIDYTGANNGQSASFYYMGASATDPDTGYLYPLITATTLIRWENIHKNGVNSGATDPAAIIPAGYLTNPPTSWAAEIVSYNIKVYDDQDVLLQTILGVDDGQLHAGSVSNNNWPNQVKQYQLTGLGQGGYFNAKVWGTTINGGGVEPVNYTHVNFPVAMDLINGCIQPNACNYNAAAISPFDSNDLFAGCIMPAGCSDSNYLEYDPIAFPTPNQPNPTTEVCGDPAACITLIVNGCTDPTAFNYSPSANIDDGSCVAVVLGCTDATQFNYDPLANTNDGSCIAPIYGCTDPTAINWDFNANTDDGSCVAFVPGCTDPLYTEYDPLANSGPGFNTTHCVTLVVNGCTNPQYAEYDPLANTDDGTCTTFIVFGCMDATQFNYNPSATQDDGSCIPIAYGCGDGSSSWDGSISQAASNYDPLANTLDPSASYTNYGATVCNYTSNPCSTITKTISANGDSPGGFVSITADFSPESTNYVGKSSSYKLYYYSGGSSSNWPLLRATGSTSIAITSGNYSAFNANGAWSNIDLASLVDGNGEINGVTSGDLRLKMGNHNYFGYPQWVQGFNWASDHRHVSNCGIGSMTIAVSFVIGCTDNAMSNYDPLATLSYNSSCIV